MKAESLKSTELSKYVLQHLLDNYNPAHLDKLPEGGLAPGSYDILFKGQPLFVRGDVLRKNGVLRAIDGTILRPDDKSNRLYLVKKPIALELYEYLLQNQDQDSLEILR